MVYPIGYYVGMRGRNLYSYCACAAPAPPLSFSCVKKKDGGERKSLNPQTRRKRTRRIKGTLSNRDSARAKGAIVRNSAYLPGRVSFSRATGALPRVVYLSDHPSCTIKCGLPVLGRRALSIERHRRTAGERCSPLQGSR